jgi:hypothetical protein
MRFTSFPSSFGIDPDKALIARLRVCSREKVSVSIMLPKTCDVVILGSKSHKNRKAVSSPRNDGIGPVK